MRGNLSARKDESRYILKETVRIKYFEWPNGFGGGSMLLRWHQSDVFTVSDSLMFGNRVVTVALWD